tara:strand:- start:376 stop:981 length:606 start_codon:yes stop_codon:yes gene_type:complete
MAQSITEVILGTGNLFVASESDLNGGSPNATFPTNPAATPSASYWDNIGYSEGGFSLEYDKTFEDIMVAEEIDPIKTIKTAQEVRITGELAQASLRSLKFAMAGGTTTADAPASGYTTLVPPTTDSFEEKSLLLRVNAPGNDEAGTSKTRDIHVPRAVNIGAFSMVHAKAPQKVTITIEYKVLKPNSDAPFANIFKVIDEV